MILSVLCQGQNQVSIIDLDNPLTWIVIQVRPGLIEAEVCIEYIFWAWQYGSML